MPQHLSDGERAACCFSIVSTMLHELAHACAYAQRCMMTRTEILRATVTLSNDIVTSLDKLGTQIFGPKGLHRGGYPGRFAQGQFFTEDAAQGEEGMNFEKQLWGGRVQTLPVAPGSTHALRPVIALFNWPTAHGQPSQQGTTQTDRRDGAYLRWLTNPRVQSWDQVCAIPVEWYARYFRKDWWRFTHQKYGHQGLKLAHQGPDHDPSRQLLRYTPLFPRYFDQTEIASVLGASAYIWFRKTVLPQLDALGLHVIGFYLTALMNEAAAVQILSKRFHNEIESWKPRYQHIARIATEVATEYQAMLDFISAHVYPALAPFSTIDITDRIGHMNNSVRPALQSMMELERLMNHEISYQQNLISTYLQQAPELRRNFHGFIVNLRQMIGGFRTLLNGQTITIRLITLDPATVGGGWDSLLDRQLKMDFPIDNDLLPLDAVAEVQMFTSLMGNVRSLHRAFRVCDDLLAENDELGQHIQPDGSVLPSVNGRPNLRLVTRAKRQGAIRTYKFAALREMRRLEDGPGKNLVREAMRVLTSGTSRLDARNFLSDRRALRNEKERLTDLDSDVKCMLTNEKQCMLQRQAGRTAGLVGVGVDPTVQDLIARILAKAGGNVQDRAYLARTWTAAVIQQHLDQVQHFEIQTQSPS